MPKEYQAEVISVALHKGGAGKTTSVINIAGGLAKMGKKTLILDCDPQCNSSSVFRDFLSDGSGTIFDLMNGVEVTPAQVKENLFIVNADGRMEEGEVHFGSKMAKESILAKKIEPFISQFDFIIIDTPPSLGIFTKNALTASDFMLMPLNPEKFSVDGYIKMKKLAVDIKDQLNPDLEILGLFFSKTKRTMLHADLMDEVRENPDFYIFKSEISEKAAVSECVLVGEDIQSYAESKKNKKGKIETKFSIPAQEVAALVDEILKRIKTYN
jgi:chromosome partitioning protein